MKSSPTLPCTVIRSRRRTAALKVTPDGVQARVPYWVSEQWVADWLHSRRAWIDSHINRLQQYVISIEQGAMLPFCGQSLQLNWYQGRGVSVSRQSDQLQIQLSGRSAQPEEVQVRQHLKLWYRQQAELLLAERTIRWQEVMQQPVSDLKVRDYRRRWGSCSAAGVISLNWRLILAEPALQDYVIVHELSHRRHFDHSKAFWHRVQQFCPEWRICREALNQRAGWLLW